MTTLITRRAIPETHQQFSQPLPNVLKRIYAARGVFTDDELDLQLAGLLPYHDLKGIDAAVARLVLAVTEQQRILIVGDFDADGATSSALAVDALRTFGASEVTYLVPNRFEYGYGLTPEIVKVANEWRPDLIITVDNGISSVDGVQTANLLGIDVLITDHHLPGDELPAATAIVNPNQPGCPFPSKNLAGVGVIFYVMLALRRALCDRQWFSQQGLSEPNMGRFLDYVALGTVADVVPLDKNNRILVKQGLQRIRCGKCHPGISALLTVAKRKAEKLVASDLGFALGPRLNAAGRLDDMSLGIECLITHDMQLAQQMAQQLDDLNQERKEIEAGMKQQAFEALHKMQLADAEAMPVGLSLYHDSWHQGVIGILAGRVKEKYHRPVIAFAKVSDTELKGSARSIPGVHIRDVLDAIAKANPGLITKFGGHAMAAGLSLELKHFKAFSKAFIAELEKHLSKQDLCGEIVTDGELESQEFNLTIAEQIREAGPFGQHFPEPCFDGKFTVVEQRLVGGKHLKLTLQPLRSTQFIDAIAFNIDENQWPNHHCTQLNMVYRLDINEYRDRVNIQLIAEHIEPIESNVIMTS